MSKTITISITLCALMIIALPSSPEAVAESLDAQTEQLSADFYAPAPAVELLELSREFDWPKLMSKPTSLTRFAMGVSGTSDLFIVTDDGNTVNPSLNILSNATASKSSSYDLLLRSMFKFIELDDGSFSIVSSKHPNYAVDVDQANSNALILRDVRSIHRDHSTAAYLGFNIRTTAPLVLSATSRWVNTSPAETDKAPQKFQRDRTWDKKSVLLTGKQLSLSSSKDSLIQLYQAPINFDIPFDFNPKEKPRASNDEVPPFSRGYDRHKTYSKDVLPEYKAQLTSPGLNPATSVAAKAMLADIQQTLALEDAQLRYPPEFYMAFREGLLKRIYTSSEATDGELGQNTVPYVYFTNDKDDEGIAHPFMVIVTYGLPDTQALLWDVALPPGDGIAKRFADQDVTRSYHKEGFAMKVPMKDYGEVSKIGENDMVNDLGSDRNVKELDHHNYASVSGLGVAIDGVVVYPTYNNALHVSAAEGELSAHGQHSGRGLGTHYHADAYSATGEIMNLYNTTDYINRTHPPIVTIGFDGVAGYGIYLSDDSDGAQIPLDDFGGHEHGDYGYHYHSFSVQEIAHEGSKHVTYTAHKLPPLGAWAGNINSIPDFWDGTSPSYGGRGNTRWLGTGSAADSTVRKRPADNSQRQDRQRQDRPQRQ